jgi:hypothetical protein
LAEKLKEKKLKEIIISEKELIGKYTKVDIKDTNGELILQSGFDITEEILEKILSSNIHKLELANVDPILKDRIFLKR